MADIRRQETAAASPAAAVFSSAAFPSRGILTFNTLCRYAVIAAAVFCAAGAVVTLYAHESDAAISTPTAFLYQAKKTAMRAASFLKRAAGCEIVNDTFRIYLGERYAARAVAEPPGMVNHFVAKTGISGRILTLDTSGTVSGVFIRSVAAAIDTIISDNGSRWCIGDLSIIVEDAVGSSIPYVVPFCATLSGNTGAVASNRQYPCIVSYDESRARAFSAFNQAASQNRALPSVSATLTNHRFEPLEESYPEQAPQDRPHGLSAHQGRAVLRNTKAPRDQAAHYTGADEPPASGRPYKNTEMEPSPFVESPHEEDESGNETAELPPPSPDLFDDQYAVIENGLMGTGAPLHDPGVDPLADRPAELPSPFLLQTPEFPVAAGIHFGRGSDRTSEPHAR